MAASVNEDFNKHLTLFFYGRSQTQFLQWGSISNSLLLQALGQVERNLSLLKKDTDASLCLVGRDLSHTCNHASCQNVFDMTIEYNEVNNNRRQDFNRPGPTDLCTTHDPPCKFYKSRIIKDDILGIPVSLIFICLWSSMIAKNCNTALSHLTSRRIDMYMVHVLFWTWVSRFRFSYCFTGI